MLDTFSTTTRSTRKLVCHGCIRVFKHLAYSDGKSHYHHHHGNKSELSSSLRSGFTICVFFLLSRGNGVGENYPTATFSTGQSTRNPRGKLSTTATLHTKLWRKIKEISHAKRGISQNPKISLRALYGLMANHTRSMGKSGGRSTWSWLVWVCDRAGAADQETNSEEKSYSPHSYTFWCEIEHDVCLATRSLSDRKIFLIFI